MGRSHGPFIICLHVLIIVITIIIMYSRNYSVINIEEAVTRLEVVGGHLETLIGEQLNQWMD